MDVPLTYYSVIMEDYFQVHLKIDFLLESGDEFSGDVNIELSLVGAAFHLSFV